jgi:hypothetical protein
MKLPALLFAGSLAANVVLLGVFAAKPALAPPAMRGLLQHLSPGSAPAANDAAPSPRATPRPSALPKAKYWSTLATTDLATLVANLRAAGFSPMVIRAIVAAQIELQFRERMNALVGSVADTPFWKPEPTSSLTNPKFYEELNQIYRARAKLLREVLGSDFLANAGGDATTAQRRQFGDIPKAKIELIQRINDDYTEMTSQVRAATQGITLPEDREKLALLAREKHADLAAILTPEELDDYEMRNSTVTSRLRQPLTLMDATEDEFRAIYKATQPAADLIYPTGGVSGPNMSRDRQDAQAKANDAIKAAIGDARFADYQRANDYEYQQLARLGQRENIPTDTLNRAFGLRDVVVKESARIYDDKEMSTDDKRAALTTLGQNTKAQVLSLLGLTAGNAYIQSSNWINAPERGWVIRVGPNGQANSFTTLPNRPPPAK